MGGDNFIHKCIENRTVHEIQSKWKNLTTLKKRKLAGLQKEINKTGGQLAPKRPPPKITTPKLTQILFFLKNMEILKDKPSFKGLAGFESLPGKWR